MSSIWLYDQPEPGTPGPGGEPNAITDAAFIQNNTFRAEDPGKEIEHYRSCSAISKSQNVPWQDTYAYAAGQNNSLTKAQTVVRFRGRTGTSVKNGALTFGWIECTWYLVFRG